MTHRDEVPLQLGPFSSKGISVDFSRNVSADVCDSVSCRRLHGLQTQHNSRSQRDSSGRTEAVRLVSGACLQVCGYKFAVRAGRDPWIATINGRIVLT